MEKTVWRKDGRVDESGRQKVLWGWKLPQSGLPYSEGIMMLCNLKPAGNCAPEIYAEGMTHEFQVFELDPATPLDFEKSLFEQPDVSPLLPSTVAYQFRAACDRDAAKRVGDLVDRVVRLQLPPDLPSEWAPLMRDGDRDCVAVGVGRKSALPRPVGGDLQGRGHAHRQGVPAAVRGGRSPVLARAVGVWAGVHAVRRAPVYSRRGAGVWA